MSTVKLVSYVPCLILLLLAVFNDVSLAVRRLPVPAAPVKQDGATGHKTLSQTPLNHAALVGETVVLSCRVVNPPPSSRIMWSEYTTNSYGSIISDNAVVVPSHPNADRYRILHFTDTQFDLEIRDLRLEDGGRYVCQDIQSGPPNSFRGEAELIVLDANPNCTTTAPANGAVIEGQTYTIECIIHYQGLYPPTMTWDGPPPFLVGNSPPSPTTVSSRVEYTVDRSMDTKAFQCLTNFSDIGSVPSSVDVASNTPDWSHLFRANQILVYWGPKDTFITPFRVGYSVGDILTCIADAYPAPFYQWQNMRTLEYYTSQNITVDQDMLGFNQTMRCQAQNLILGVIYSDNAYGAVYVPDICVSSPCLHGTLCLNDVGGYKCDCDTGYTGTKCESEIPKPCSNSPCYNGTPSFDESGGYTCHCYPDYTGIRCETRITKPCSQISQRPYPILIQQHTYPPSSFFNMSWSQMLEEQGSTTGNYWLGLRELHQILQEGKGRFRLKMVLNFGDNDILTTYDTFMIGPESDNFTLTVGGYTGNNTTPGDAMHYHNGMMFTTYDRDNDRSFSNAAVSNGGGFWHYVSDCNAGVNSSPAKKFVWRPPLLLYYLQKSQMYLECKSEWNTE